MRSQFIRFVDPWRTYKVFIDRHHSRKRRKFQSNSRHFERKSTHLLPTHRSLKRKKHSSPQNKKQE